MAEITAFRLEMTITHSNGERRLENSKASYVAIEPSIRKRAKTRENVKTKVQSIIVALQGLGINSSIQYYALLDTLTSTPNMLSISLIFNLSKPMGGSNYTG